MKTPRGAWDSLWFENLIQDKLQHTCNKNPQSENSYRTL